MISSSSSATSQIRLPRGHFDKTHLIASGIDTLFEGRTLCYPETNNHKLKVFAQSSDDYPAVLYYSDEEKGSGRVVVDTGFSKLWQEWHTAGVLYFCSIYRPLLIQSLGTARYINNATVWLLALERRLEYKLPLKGITNTHPKLSSHRTPLNDLVATVGTGTGYADVIFIMDTSAATSESAFKIMKGLCKSVCNAVYGATCSYHL